MEQKQSRSFSLISGSVVAVVLLVLMGALLLFRAYNDAAIFDETAHIISGYATVVERDYRINPEHPPLVKMASALPLAFQNINSPLDRPDFTEKLGTESQWTLGNAIIYEVGNDATSLTFWSRVGPILIALLLGAILFIWARRLYGTPAALLALTLYVFSPTFLAHGAYVTTDVGASFAFFFATFFLFRYLNRQSKTNLILAGVAFGIAQAIKFSLILIIPYFAVIAVAWVLFKNRPLRLFSLRTVGRIGIYWGKLALIGVIGLIVIYPLYLYATWDYPVEEQVRQTREILDNSPYRLDANRTDAAGNPRQLDVEPSFPGAVVWMAQQPVLRPYAQFFMGHLMVFQRVSGGNTTYFLGEVSASGWWYYFPAIFAFKVPLALLFLMTLSLGVTGVAFVRGTRVGMKGYAGAQEKIRRFARLIDGWIQEYFWELIFLLFIAFYWVVSIMGNLNIGVRHVLPTFPFLYLVLVGVLIRWMRLGSVPTARPLLARIHALVQLFFVRWLKFSVLFILVAWYTLSSLAVYPHSLSYFNELTGGPENGYRYAVDSNLDWGQDIRGLAAFMEQNDIEHIRLSYFGPGSAVDYYLGERALPMNPFNEEHRTGWIAVSATFLQGGRAEATGNFTESTTHYEWINDYEPRARIGYSIFIYHIPEDEE